VTRGFHDGELAVQREAGVVLQAGRLEGMLAPADLSGGAGGFLAKQTFAALTARDGDGVLWTSPLAAPAGFLQGHGEVLRIVAVPGDGDPLQDLPVGQQVGLIAIDFSARRRIRINGRLAVANGGALEVQVDQAYGNCPQYIHRQVPAAAGTSSVERGNSMPPAARQLVAAADTFFLGTTHPTRGNDASHRGGPPGFVRVVSPSRLWWPDFPGNNMFNSFGNLAVDDEAALLFPDFASGTTVQLSGTAQLSWTQPGAPGDDGGVGRRVDFVARDVITRTSADKTSQQS
jgi:predicted pyridoxine 5'-phosphate oxidase superfamily flavin-nucleotide-binding protein